MKIIICNIFISIYLIKLYDTIPSIMIIMMGYLRCKTDVTFRSISVGCVGLAAKCIAYDDGTVSVQSLRTC